MNSLLYLFRFLYRIRYWLIICPILVALFVYVKTSSMGRTYNVYTTIYTGVVSGYDIESIGSGEKQDWNIINNAMDNLINIITSQATLKSVSMRLFAQHMMYGNPNEDNNYITRESFQALLRKTPKDVVALIDKNSEEQTLENLSRYEKANSRNYVYGLFNWTPPHYSYEALSKIKVKRMGNSDMLEISYTTDDPAIAYQTLVLLNEEFVKQYQELRFGETNNVIQYFEEELVRVGGLLKNAEDSLTDYNVDKRVINYDEQTKHIAAQSRDFELKYESILLDYKGAEKLIEELEQRIDEHTKALKNNALFVGKLNSISNLTAQIVTKESFQTDSLNRGIDTEALKKRLKNEEKELAEITNNIGIQRYSKEGLATTTLVDQWLDVIIRFQKAKAELAVMEGRKERLDNEYVFYSPVGSVIKRKERDISLTEQSYLSILSSLNAARLKKKSLQMSSATLKIINPPTFPISAMPTKRKLLVAASFIGTMIFVLGYFILLELVDRTLRDKNRTERITGGRVLGAFPAPDRFRYRSYAKSCREIASRFMGNAVLNYFKQKKPDIINIMSTEEGTGKSFLAESLQEYYREIGLNVRYVSWHEDFSVERKNFLLARSLSEFIDLGASDSEDLDVILVEYPALKTCSVPRGLMQEAAVNLIVARGNRVWKDTDQLLFDKVIESAGPVPVFIYLNQAKREVVETFTGLLPPYTGLRRKLYRFYQMGFTSVGK